jgi:hypothetical protein
MSFRDRRRRSPLIDRGSDLVLPMTQSLTIHLSEFSIIKSCLLFQTIRTGCHQPSRPRRLPFPKYRHGKPSHLCGQLSTCQELSTRQLKYGLGCNEKPLNRPSKSPPRRYPSVLLHDPLLSRYYIRTMFSIKFPFSSFRIEIFCGKGLM